MGRQDMKPTASESCSCSCLKCCSLESDNYIHTSCHCMPRCKILHCSHISEDSHYSSHTPHRNFLAHNCKRSCPVGRGSCRYSCRDCRECLSCFPGMSCLSESRRRCCSCSEARTARHCLEIRHHRMA